jgi:hypothetical protein
MQDLIINGVRYYQVRTWPKNRTLKQMCNKYTQHLEDYAHLYDWYDWSDISAADFRAAVKSRKVYEVSATDDCAFPGSVAYGAGYWLPKGKRLLAWRRFDKKFGGVIDFIDPTGDVVFTWVGGNKPNLPLAWNNK